MNCNDEIRQCSVVRSSVNYLGQMDVVPRMIDYNQGGHVITTASLGAFLAAGPAGIYTASKFAVRGLSEALRSEVEKYNIGVTVLCPANVNTNIAESVRTRPQEYSDSGYIFDDEVLDSLRRIYSAGKDPVELAEEVLKAVKENRKYCIPYPEARQALESHFAEVIASLPPEDADLEGVAKRQAAMEQYRKELMEKQYKGALVRNPGNITTDLALRQKVMPLAILTGLPSELL